MECWINYGIFILQKFWNIKINEFYPYGFSGGKCLWNIKGGNRESLWISRLSLDLCLQKWAEMGTVQGGGWAGCALSERKEYGIVRHKRLSSPGHHRQISLDITSPVFSFPDEWDFHVLYSQCGQFTATDLLRSRWQQPVICHPN